MKILARESRLAMQLIAIDPFRLVALLIIIATAMHFMLFGHKHTPFHRLHPSTLYREATTTTHV